MQTLLRTLALTAVLGAAIFFVAGRIARRDESRALQELRALNDAFAQRLAEREAAMARLSRSHRIAHLVVEEQRVGIDGRPIDTVFLLIELDDDGRDIARQRFLIPGGVAYIDAWTVRFDPEDVGAGHPLRGRTLVLLRRVFSEELAPADAIPIDLPGAVPPGYAAGDLARFEREIWRQFWEVAADPARAARFGVRVAQGEAVYAPLHPGQVLELRVEAVGGMTLTTLRRPGSSEGEIRAAAP